VRAASFTSSMRVSESALLLVRAAIFSWCFFILAQSAFHEGPGCLRFFTVWNFIVLTVFFGIGTGLSCTCCRHSAQTGSITRDHRVWAGLHRLLFEIELPMTMLVAVVVWFAIYPNAVSVAEQTGDYSGQLAVLSLTSITMHALNVIFMMVEFALNGLLVEAWHFGLIVAWASLYGLFNGLQAVFTGDTVYFFMDFSLIWMPVICLVLTSVVLVVHGIACVLSVCKRKLLMDAQRARELLEEGPSSTRASPRASPRAREAGGEDSARSYLLWRDKPGGTATGDSAKERH